MQVLGDGEDAGILPGQRLERRVVAYAVLPPFQEDHRVRRQARCAGSIADAHSVTREELNGEVADGRGRRHIPKRARQLLPQEPSSAARAIRRALLSSCPPASSASNVSTISPIRGSASAQTASIFRRTWWGESSGARMALSVSRRRAARKNSAWWAMSSATHSQPYLAEPQRNLVRTELLAGQLDVEQPVVQVVGRRWPAW